MSSGGNPIPLGELYDLGIGWVGQESDVLPVPQRVTPSSSTYCRGKQGDELLAHFIHPNGTLTDVEPVA